MISLARHHVRGIRRDPRSPPTRSAAGRSPRECKRRSPRSCALVWNGRRAPARRRPHGHAPAARRRKARTPPRTTTSSQGVCKQMRRHHRRQGPQIDDQHQEHGTPGADRDRGLCGPGTNAATTHRHPDSPRGPGSPRSRSAPAPIATLSGIITRQARIGRVHSHQLKAVANRSQASARRHSRASSNDSTAGVSRAHIVIARPVNARRGPSVNKPNTAPTKGNASSGARLDRKDCALAEAANSIRPPACDPQNTQHDAAAADPAPGSCQEGRDDVAIDPRKIPQFGDRHTLVHLMHCGAYQPELRHWAIAAR